MDRLKLPVTLKNILFRADCEKHCSSWHSFTLMFMSCVSSVKRQ